MRITVQLTNPELAINGGTPVRCAGESWPAWPIFDESDVEALRRVVTSGNWRMGENVAAFTREFADYQQARYAVPVTNGTQALEIALKACGIACGDEVIVPPYSFIATATACIMVNAVPVFADIDPGTYCIDPEAIEATITPRTKAIIGVHVGGHLFDFDRILPLAEEHGLKVIEDACHAWGAEWQSRRVGTIGDAGVFSFQASKNLNAGEGGIVVTNDEAIYQAAWALHNLGRVQGGGWYQHDILGGNHRMTEFQGALLRSQMERLDEQQDRRNENREYLNGRLAEIEGVKPQTEDPRITRHGCHGYIMRYDSSAFSGLHRDDFIEALHAEGVPAWCGWPTPLYQNDAFRTDGKGRLVGAAWAIPMGRNYHQETHCPVCERVCREEALWLMQQILLGSRQDMDDIIRAIEKIAQAVR